MNFNVKYQPEKINLVADTLSKNPLLHNINILTTELIELDKLKQMYLEDLYFADIYKLLQNENITNSKVVSRAKYYELDNEVIYLKEEHRLAISKDKSLVTIILKEHHDNHIAGHFGVDKTYENVARTFYWPKMIRAIKQYIQSCDVCQRNKGSNQTPAGLLQPLDTPAQKWEQVTMDFIVQLPLTKQGFDAIFVVVDRLSKRAHFIPTHTTVTAPEVAKLFFNIIFKDHGLPRIIVSDRDAKFTSKFW